MDKIKQFIEGKPGRDILTALIVILVGLGSFGLGRLSKDSKSAGLKIEYPGPGALPSGKELVQPANALSAPVANQLSANFVKNPPVSGKTFFASKVGHKYYSIGCSGGKTIKESNKVYFNTEAEAISAGYEKSASCK